MITWNKKHIIRHIRVLASYEYKGRISRYIRIKNAKKTIFTWVTDRCSRRHASGKTVIWGTSIVHR